MKDFRSPFNNKALSPIFATLIILAVVTVLFIPVFIWAAGTTSQTQESWQTSGVIATERIVVEEVDLNIVDSDCTVYVRNIGKTAVTINNVLIIDPDGTVFSYERNNGELSTVDPSSGNGLNSIVQGELIEIDIPNLGFALLQSNAYTLKVFTTRGVGDTYQAVA
jgi:flagellin-like protein